MRSNFIFLALLLLVTNINAQETEYREIPGNVGLKTNLLYDATGTFNLGLEFRTGERTSFELPVNWNPWTFSGNRKWKHVLVQPEFRWWTTEAFKGHFFGVHAHYAFYNVSRLPNGPFSRNMADSRYEGWLAGAGLSYGYRWNFSRNWALEATIGVGYAYLDYKKYECGDCGERIGADTKNYFGPTKAGITLIYNIGGKKKPVRTEPVYVPVVVQEPEPVKEVVIYNPQFTVSYLTPEAETVKTRSEAGQAYLDFAAGRSEIVFGFKNNAAELQKINNLIENVKNNPDATITGITITGYASPEGLYQTNLRLSEKRAYALKQLIINQYGFSDSMFTVSGRGEDWAMLDSLVTQSDMPEKAAILNIIRSTGVFDGREKKLMNLTGGKPYREMLSTMFPQLRRSEYELHYTVLPFTVEKGKEVLKTNPGNLSLNEMFLIANTYEPGSHAFDEVFETAARLFPTDDTANLNAAASALARKDTVSAEQYLAKIKEQSPEYWNNLGILAFVQGDTEKAAECFAKAGTVAAGNASELDKHNQSKQF
ncbi:DUF3575 domain-containing protein [Bacteroides sp. 51]|uniref:DUF3575 domain-containing protein n=1 Tax=Bacteroides sp. 51 TaxID=2302938 RepID=UPI0013D6AB7B|nr:DUF3575 domain-containing protein [Bacteroides sp. 51]NDV82361.1 DUF3575 domain-containing protein [Bacteroides sp. 51]